MNRGTKLLIAALCALVVVLPSIAAAQGSRYFQITNGAAGDTTAVHMADSSAVIKLYGFRARYLAMKIFATGASLDTVSWMAISVRWHKDGNSDSTSIMPVALLDRSSMGASATVDSTVKTGDLVGSTATSVPAANELVVQFNRRAFLWRPRFGYLIDLERYFGDLAGLDAVSIRWRHLSGPGVATTWISLVATR